MRGEEKTFRIRGHLVVDHNGLRRSYFVCVCVCVCSVSVFVFVELTAKLAARAEKNHPEFGATTKREEEEERDNTHA